MSSLVSFILSSLEGSAFQFLLNKYHVLQIIFWLFLAFLMGIELAITHIFSWYGAYFLLLLWVVGIAYFWKKQRVKLIFSLMGSQILLWLVFFIFSMTEAFEGGAFNFNKTRGFPIRIPFMRDCPSCGSDVPPLETFPFFFVNWCLFFLTISIIVYFLPKKILNSKILQWIIWVLSFFAVFCGIAWLGILYD